MSSALIPVNARVYITNGHKFTINSSTETSDPSFSYKYEPKSIRAHFDGTKQKDVAAFRAYVVKDAAYPSDLITSGWKLNMTRYDTLETNIELRSLTVTVDPNSIGSFDFTYGSTTTTLSNEDSFENEVTDEFTTGPIKIDPTVGDTYFYGKITLTYKIFKNTARSSSTATSTIWVLPYPNIKLITVDDINVSVETISSVDTYVNTVTYKDYYYKTSDCSPKLIPLVFANYNDVSTDDDTVFRAPDNPTPDERFVAAYISSTISGTVSINSSRIVSTLLDGEPTNTNYFTFSQKTAVYKIPWTATNNLNNLRLNTTETGTYQISINFVFNAVTQLLSQSTMPAVFVFRVNSQLFTGETEMGVDPTGSIAFNNEDSIGYITSFRTAGVPLIRVVRVISGTSLNLIDDKFRFSTVVIVENLTDDTITVTTAGTATEMLNEVYITDQNDVNTVSSKKKKIFMRVLFTPPIWEQSAEFVEDENINVDV